MPGNGLLGRLGECEVVAIRILDAELAHTVLHHFGTPREFYFASELIGERTDSGPVVYLR